MKNEILETLLNEDVGKKYTKSGLGKKNLKVLMSFLDQKKDEGGDRLNTDGKQLDILAMGGTKVAWWEDGKINFRSPNGRADQALIKTIKKIAPKFDLAESLDERVIKAPKNVLKTDIDFVVSEYFKGNVDLKDLKDTFKKNNQKYFGNRKDLEKSIKNPYMLDYNSTLGTKELVKLVKDILDDGILVKENINERTTEFKAGFDLTNIKGSDWKEMIKDFKLDYKGVKKGKNGGSKFHLWAHKNGKDYIKTKNNPITGEYAGEGRNDEKNYASYIGIYGGPTFVENAFSYIEYHAISYKEKNNKESNWI